MISWKAVDAALLAGMRPRDVRAKFGVSLRAIRTHSIKLGIPPRRPGRQAGDGDRAPRSAVTDVLVDRMDNIGRSQRAAATEIGVSKGTAGHAHTRWVRGVVGRAGRGPVGRAGKEKRGTKATATWNGETLTLAAWSERTGLKVDTIAYRLRVGWPVWRALTEAPAGRAGGES